MINGKKVIAVIPARGGSKGLPRKNILDICGKPLLSWTIEKAKKSKFLDETIVSTDDEEIADIAKSYGGVVPFIRPAYLAEDQSKTVDVVKHCLDFMRSAENESFSYTLLLEPTSPLREDTDIDNIIATLDRLSDDFDSLVTVGQVSEHPALMKRINSNSIEMFYPTPDINSRRQDLEPAYFPYGVGYMVKTDKLIEEGTFHTKRCTYFLIQKYQNYEIDDLYDFICVENIMKTEWGLA